MSEMTFEERPVKVMVVEPNGTWAMVRSLVFKNAMPFVVSVRELSKPIELCPYYKKPFSANARFCQWCGRKLKKHYEG